MISAEECLPLSQQIPHRISVPEDRMKEMREQLAALQLDSLSLLDHEASLTKHLEQVRRITVSQREASHISVQTCLGFLECRTCFSSAMTPWGVHTDSSDILVVVFCSLSTGSVV